MMIDPAYIRVDGDDYEVRVFENERYRLFKGWSRPTNDSADPSYISYAFGPSTDFESLETIACPLGWMWRPDSAWAVDLNYTKTNSFGWSYATSFARMNKKYSENISSSSPTLRQVTRRRLWSRLIQKEVSPLDGFDVTGMNSSCALFNSYKVQQEVLGTGGFSVVRLGLQKSTGIKVAVKCVNLAKLSANDESDVLREIELLKEIHHPHVVRLYDSYRDDQFIFIVLEMVHGGELFDWIVSKDEYLETEARDLMYTLLQTLAHLHRHNIVHRDIKPENILMLSANDTSIKLTDFGFAAKCKDDFSLHDGCGSPSYVAPEILLRVPYGRPVDVWSVGVVGYILLCGYAPFNAPNDKQMFELIKQGKFRFHSDAWDAISDDAKDLISHLLVVNAETRLTAQDALNHPWFNRAGLKTCSLDITLQNLKKFQALKKFRVAGKAVVAVRRFSAPKAIHSLVAASTDEGKVFGIEGQQEQVDVTDDKERPSDELAATTLSGKSDGIPRDVSTVS